MVVNRKAEGSNTCSSDQFARWILAWNTLANEDFNSINRAIFSAFFLDKLFLCSLESSSRNQQYLLCAQNGQIPLKSKMMITIQKQWDSNNLYLFLFLFDWQDNKRTSSSFVVSSLVFALRCCVSVCIWANLRWAVGSSFAGGPLGGFCLVSLSILVLSYLSIRI